MTAIGKQLKRWKSAHILAKLLLRQFPTFAIDTRELAAELQCNIMGYDYSGYGTSTGTPSVANTL